MRDGICLPLEKMLRATNTRWTSLSVENPYGGTTPELFIEEVLKCLPECVKEFVLVEETHVYDGDLRMKFLE